MVLYGLLLVCIGLLGLIIWFCLRLVRGDLVVVFGYWLDLARLGVVDVIAAFRVWCVVGGFGAGFGLYCYKL